MDDITILLEQIQEHLTISNISEENFGIVMGKLEDILMII